MPYFLRHNNVCKNIYTRESHKIKGHFLFSRPGNWKHWLFRYYSQVHNACMRSKYCFIVQLSVTAIMSQFRKNTWLSTPSEQCCAFFIQRRWNLQGLFAEGSRMWWELLESRRDLRVDRSFKKTTGWRGVAKLAAHEVKVLQRRIDRSILPKWNSEAR